MDDSFVDWVIVESIVQKTMLHGERIGWLMVLFVALVLLTIILAVVLIQLIKNSDRYSEQSPLSNQRSVVLEKDCQEQEDNVYVK